jgi:hypothetical protein
MKGFNCSTCGQYHEEMPMCFGASAPELYWRIPEQERNTRIDLTSDQCVIDEQHFFVLGRILIPVEGLSEPFVWLCWVSLSETNFLRACELWHSEGRESEPPYFSWIQSDLPYEKTTLSLKASITTMPLGERPLIKLHECDHPIYFEQRDGITLSRVQQIAETALHGA